MLGAKIMILLCRKISQEICVNALITGISHDAQLVGYIHVFINIFLLALLDLSQYMFLSQFTNMV